MSEVQILSLAYIPENSKEIIDWRPFGEDTLGKIVNDYNVRCLEIYNDLGWHPENISKIVDLLDIVRYDLNGLGKLSSVDFETIVILFADLDVAYEKEKELGWVRDFLGKKPKDYYLIQVSTRSGSLSLTDFFQGSPITPYPLTPPHLLSTQLELENFIYTYFMRMPAERVKGGGGTPPQPGGAGDPASPAGLHLGGISQDEFAEAYANVKAEIRHEAIVNKLSANETTALADLAVQQELALQNVSSLVDHLPYEHVVVNSLRKPVQHIALQPFQLPDFRPVDLVQVRPSGPFGVLSGQQRSILRRMGIKNETYTSVVANTPFNRNLVNTLGNSVRASRLSAILPVFKSR